MPTLKISWFTFQIRHPSRERRRSRTRVSAPISIKLMSTRVFLYMRAVHVHISQERDAPPRESMKNTQYFPTLVLMHALIDTNISLWLIKSNIHTDSVTLDAAFTTANTHKTPCITSQHVIIYP
jgi:hypothetical protein